MATFIKFEVSKIEGLADRIRGLTPEQIVRSNVDALNVVTDRAFNLARDRITVGINLTDDYLRRRMTVRPATEGKPVATITASGARSDMTPLSRYDGKMVLAPKKHTRSRGTGKLGIPYGQKQRAVQVEVTRGNQSTLLYAFAQPLRAGAVEGGNGIGIFTRSRDGKKRHRYGPAVYQLFRYQINSDPFNENVQDDLADSVLQVASVAMEEVLK